MSGTAERNNLRRRLLRRIPRNTAPPLEPPSVAVRRRCLHCGLLSAGEWPGGVAERAWPRAYRQNFTPSAQEGSAQRTAFTPPAA